MKKTFLYIIMIFGVIGLIILYSPIGSPSLYNTQTETFYVQNPGITLLNSNMSNLPKISSYTPSYNESEQSDQFVNEPIAQLPSSNFGSNNTEMPSNYQSRGSLNSYTQSSKKSEEPSVNSGTYSTMPVMSFGRKSRNESESQGQFSSISNGTSINDNVLLNYNESNSERSDCASHDNDHGCGHYSHGNGHGYGHDKDCPETLPVGDGTITIIVLLIGYSIFKYYKNEKNKQVLGTK